MVRCLDRLVSHQVAEAVLLCTFSALVLVAVVELGKIMSSTTISGIIIFATIVILLWRTSKFRSGPVREFRKALWRRYTGENDFTVLTAAQEQIVTNGRPRIDKQNADRLIAHIDRIVDRQINKARGILPFNSVLLAILAYEKTNLPAPIPLLLIVALAVSSLCCLAMFLVQWSGSDAYTSFSKEYAVAVGLAQSRSILIECAAWISAAALLIGAVVLLVPPQ